MQPSTRDEFEVAIICALPLEADAVEALFDETYDKSNQRLAYNRETQMSIPMGKLALIMSFSAVFREWGKGTLPVQPPVFE